MPRGPALVFDHVTLRRERLDALADLSWVVGAGERWVVLGPNGSGKTTLLQLATGHLHPTMGTVDILGERLGRVDVRQLRTRIGLVSGAVTRLLRPGLTAAEVVLTGRYAALEPWWHRYSDEDHERASDLLVKAGLGDARDRAFGVLSEGERQQVLLSRAMMGEPELLVFDEPAAGLDLGARERLVRRLEDIATDPSAPPVVFVTHHVEEIPPGFGHLLLLRQGRAVASGPITATLTSAALSETFGLAVDVHRLGDRYVARGGGPVPRQDKASPPL
jgi:iron complex transport system ATP-binding protein